MKGLTTSPVAEYSKLRMVNDRQYSGYVDLLPRVNVQGLTESLREIYSLIDKDSRPQCFHHRYELDSAVQINRATRA